MAIFETDYDLHPSPRALQDTLCWTPDVPNALASGIVVERKSSKSLELVLPEEQGILFRPVRSEDEDGLLEIVQESIEKQLSREVVVEEKHSTKQKREKKKGTFKGDLSAEPARIRQEIKNSIANPQQLLCVVTTIEKDVGTKLGGMIRLCAGLDPDLLECRDDIMRQAYLKANEAKLRGDVKEENHYLSVIRTFNDIDPNRDATMDLMFKTTGFNEAVGKKSTATVFLDLALKNLLLQGFKRVFFASWPDLYVTANYTFHEQPGYREQCVIYVNRKKENSEGQVELVPDADRSSFWYVDLEDKELLAKFMQDPNFVARYQTIQQEAA
jgi:hypothetical protein